MSGTGGKTDYNDITLPPSACQGHRDHDGRGKPTPLPVPPVRHSGSLEGYERAACVHHSVFQGGGIEETAAGRRGDTGERREDISGLRQSSPEGHLVQIPGAGLDGGR